MLWILGAIVLVAAVYGLSWWLVHHGNPVLRFFGRHPRLRFTLVVVVTVAVGVLGFLLVFHPERLFGVDGDALGSSLSREVKRAEGGSCRPEKSGGWRCSVDVGTSEAASRTFDLEFDGGACWEATEGKGKGGRETLSGCVGVLDYIAPKGRDFQD